MPQKPETIKAHVTIAGGGVAGLALACLLGPQGVKVHLIEPRPPHSADRTPVTSRTVALMESSLNILRASGAADIIAAHGVSLHAMRIIDDSLPGRGDIDACFPASAIGMERFGVNIPNDILRAALYEIARSCTSVTLHAPGALQDFAIQKSAVIATLEDGIKIESALIVGADGQNSKVRALAGIEYTIKNYRQAAITCLIRHSRPHDNTATEFHRPAGPLAFVPMNGNLSSVVWIESTERADALMKLRRDEFIRLLQEKSNDILGTLSLELNPQSWPLRTLQADSLIAPRVALIAEAAHVMSPITAQGLNLSLRDVGALAETIIDCLRAGIDTGSDTVLQKYRRRRLTDIQTRVFGVDRMNSIVSTDFGLMKRLRRGGLKTVRNLAPLKKFATHHGLAPDIDSGRLAKGLPL